MVDSVLAPRRDISGGKVIRQKSRESKNRVANALRMAAESLSRSDSYLGARYRQLRGRLGGPKAVKAMARYLACLVYRLLTKVRLMWIVAPHTSNTSAPNARWSTCNAKLPNWV
jgi:hypothetical protein